MNKRRRRLARHRRKFRLTTRRFLIDRIGGGQYFIDKNDQMGYIGLGLSYIDAVG